MRDDDLFGPSLSPPPTTSPIVRGAAAVMVTVALATTGCGPSNPGPPPDASTYTTGVDTGPPIDASNYVTGVDTGPLVDASVAPTPDAYITGVDTGPLPDAGP